MPWSETEATFSLSLRQSRELSPKRIQLISRVPRDNTPCRRICLVVAVLTYHINSLQFIPARTNFGGSPSDLPINSPQLLTASIQLSQVYKRIPATSNVHCTCMFHDGIRQLFRTSM